MTPLTLLRRLCLPILFICLCAFVQPASGFYTWTDEKGVRHFSDTPPPAGGLDRLQVRETDGTTFQPQGPEPRSTLEKHFLWSVETNKNTIYLLGSLHVLTKDSYPLAQEIENAYRHCQKIVFETDIDGLNNPMMQAKIMTLGLYPLDQTLRQHVSEKTYAALKKKVAEAGLSMTVFERLKPWSCGVTLTIMALERMGFDLRYGIDTTFFQRAKKDGKERIFLEPVEYQINLLANMGKQDQELSLRQTLDDLEVVETMAPDMLDAWENGDVHRLDTIMNASLKKYPDIHDRLLVQRNKKWLSQIENLMNQDDNVLVIVGAAHLVGAESLVALLRGKGHHVTQR
ncbi:MAG: TraB/GumN family protein [Thermodesulfobacteriota bacterium]|nr:TraB/GumN family protein [Thermodesulfobacteriota bacterium]